ncbi:uncharacterized protein LOC130735284 [Lotus japonicus]|uniref:uncharacterized protein LOC130735284 n=1 Tax=Lotus japonicus TaxID=34305 RepID=UPI00258E7DFB|nr:uncharacterized protein LOC130735284 [Lotus japonicus]
MMKKTDSRIPTTRRTSYQNCYSNCNLPSSSSSIMAAESNSSRNPILEPLLHALDPISLILNQNSQSEMQSFPFPLKLTSADSFIMERGPNYNAYAQLRERRLQMKLNFMGQEQESEQKLESEPKTATTPPRKQVKFLQSDLGCGRKSGFSSVAQSVPDFSAVLRKENRKPVMVNTLPTMMEMTPPSKRGGNRVLSTSSRGSKSASGGEKGGGGGGGGVLMARKSYASFDELKRLTSATAIAINGEGRGGGRNSSKIIMGRTVSGKNRQF